MWGEENQGSEGFDASLLFATDQNYRACLFASREEYKRSRLLEWVEIFVWMVTVK